MVRIKPLLIAALVVIVGIFIVTRFFGSEEKKVKKQFGLLSDLASKNAGEGVITTAQKMQRMGALFDEHCELKTHIDTLSGTFTPAEILSYAARGRAQFSTFSLQFSDLRVEFPEKEAAKVNLAVRATGRMTTGQHIDEAREFESTLRKHEKKWRFTSFHVVEVLKR